MDEFVDVGSTADLPEGRALVSAFGHRIALFRVEGSYAALGARCPHAGGPLEQGAIKDGVLMCPWHGSRFSLETGEVIGGPAPRAVPVFPVRIEGGRILIGPPPPGTEPPPPTLF